MFRKNPYYMNTPLSLRLPSPETHSSHNPFLYSLIIISIFLAYFHVEKMIFFVLLWEPPFCGGPCSPEHAEHAYIRLWFFG